MVFAMSRAIGKYMENCGLNKRLSDSGIYSPLVVGKIIEGKNMKRCFSYNSEYIGPILNIIQIGLEYVPTCHNQLIEELTLANLFQSSRRSEKISRNRASSSTNCHGNDTHHIAVHESYQTATLEHKLSIVGQIQKYFLALDLQTKQ